MPNHNQIIREIEDAISNLSTTTNQEIEAEESLIMRFSDPGMYPITVKMKASKVVGELEIKTNSSYTQCEITTTNNSHKIVLMRFLGDRAWIPMELFNILKKSRYEDI